MTTAFILVSSFDTVEERMSFIKAVEQHNGKIWGVWDGINEYVRNKDWPEIYHSLVDKKTGIVDFEKMSYQFSEPSDFYEHQSFETIATTAMAGIFFDVSDAVAFKLKENVRVTRTLEIPSL